MVGKPPGHDDIDDDNNDDDEVDDVVDGDGGDDDDGDDNDGDDVDAVGNTQARPAGADPGSTTQRRSRRRGLTPG